MIYHCTTEGRFLFKRKIKFLSNEICYFQVSGAQWGAITKSMSKIIPNKNIFQTKL